MKKILFLFGLLVLVLEVTSQDTFKTLQTILRVVEGRDASPGRATLSYGGKKNGESPIYYIQMPPSSYYYSHTHPINKNNKFSKVPVSFHTNGKPSKVYHWKNNKYLNGKIPQMSLKKTTTTLPLLKPKISLTTIEKFKSYKPVQIPSKPIDNQISKRKLFINPISPQKKIMKPKLTTKQSYQSPIFRIKPSSSNPRLPTPRLWNGNKKFNGKTTGLYLWESKYKSSYNNPVYIKLKN